MTAVAGLLERGDAIAALDAALRAVADEGKGHIALVSGEAGIGKTTLLREFVRRCGHDVAIHWGSCDALFTPRPLLPLHDMAHGLGTRVVAALDRDAGAAGGASRVELFNAVLDALGRLPQVLVFEDVHWADEATLDLLAWLGRRIGSTRTLLVASYRDDEVNARHPLRQVLGSWAGACRVTLPPLSIDAVRCLAQGRRDDAAALHRASGGNPFFVTELIAVGAGGVPETVRDAVLARAARLPAAAREALDAAAVIGPRIETVLVEAVAGGDASALDACVAAGVLRDTGGERIEFRHELAREVVLSAISPARRLALHRAVLAALRVQSPADPARLAHHAEGAQDRDAVLAFAPAAAREAAAVGAKRQAHDQYARALRFADALPAAQHADLLEAFALECLGVGDVSAGIEARRRAIVLRAELGQPARQAENLCRLSNLFVDAGRSDDADDALRQAFALLEALPPCREAAYAWRTRAHLSMLGGDDEQAIEAAERSTVLAERFGDDESVISALNSKGMAMSRRDFDAGCALLEQSGDMARAAGRTAQVFNAEINLGETSAEMFHLERAERHLLAAMAIADDLQMDTSVPESTLALCRLSQGQWNEAADLARHVLAGYGPPEGARPPWGDPALHGPPSSLRSLPPEGARPPWGGPASGGPERRTSRTLAQTVLGRLRARRGDAGAWAMLDESLPVALASAQPIYIASVRAARAEAAWLEGDHARCADEARAAYDLVLRHRHPWFSGELACWLRRAGQPVRHGAACNADQPPALPPFVAAPHALLHAGRWQEAADAWHALGCAYEQALALSEGGSAAQREALAIFERLGARPAAHALRARLQAAGERGLARGPRASTRERPFGLTAREQQTLQLLCEGLHNVEIAARLHRSVRTVDHHVSAVLGKLGVDSRAAAIALAQHAQIGQARIPK